MEIWIFPIALVMMLAFIIPLALYYAWAATYLWAWFVVPVFAVPQLSVLQMWGILLTLGMMRARFDTEKKNSDNFGSALFALAFAPLLTLGIGYAIRFWWM